MNDEGGRADGTARLPLRTFDVLRSGTSPEPDEHSDVVALTLAERAVLECPSSVRTSGSPDRA